MAAYMDRESQKTLIELSETLARRAERNRRNAEKSTGPRSAEGKARVSRNALKHGLRSADPLALPESDPAEMQAQARALEVLRGELRADLRPMGALEEVLFQRVVNTAWRLRRVPLAEQYMLRRDREARKARLEVEMQDRPRRRRVPIDERELRSSALLARWFSEGSDRQDRLRRYEASAERSFYRAVDTLRKAQLARQKMNEQSHFTTETADSTPEIDCIYDNRINLTGSEQTQEQSHEQSQGD